MFPRSAIGCPETIARHSSANPERFWPKTCIAK
jgi:hypothetical protein